MKIGNANRRTLLVGALGAVLGAVRPAAKASVSPVIVFAAASLAEVLGTLAGHWARAPQPLNLRLSFAASSTLARQIEQGAPAHLFISADESWMDRLASRGVVDPASRTVVAGNRLVVIRPGVVETGARVPPEERDAIAAAIGTAGRIAAGDPTHVPAGRYAEAALRSLGLWNDARKRLVRADSVRTALAFVERGEADSGIVYATDARVSRRVAVAARFPAASHPPIRYPAARVAGAPPAAAEVLARLAAPQSRDVLRAAGFVVD